MLKVWQSRQRSGGNEGSGQAGGTRAEAVNQSITATSSGLRKTSSDFYQQLQT